MRSVPCSGGWWVDGVGVMNPSGYPEHREVDVPLRDGSTIHVRPVLPSDLYAVKGLFARLSTESSRLRQPVVGDRLVVLAGHDVIDDLGRIAQRVVHRAL